MTQPNTLMTQQIIVMNTKATWWHNTAPEWHKRPLCYHTKAMWWYNSTLWCHICMVLCSDKTEWRLNQALWSHNRLLCWYNRALVYHKRHHGSPLEHWYISVTLGFTIGLCDSTPGHCNNTRGYSNVIIEHDYNILGDCDDTIWHI